MRTILIRPPAGAFVRHYHMTKEGFVGISKKWRKYKDGTVGAVCRKCSMRFLMTANSKTDDLLIVK